MEENAAMPTVGVLGAGLIGRSWAMVFSRAGWDVKLTDIDTNTLEAAVGLIGVSLADQAKHGLVGDGPAAVKRVRSVKTIESAAEGADLVIECGPERVESKIRLFAKIDTIAPNTAILASSSSAIVPSRFTEQLRGRERCLVAHPVNPPHLVPVVELCGAPWTSVATIARARALFEGIGQVPVEVKREIEGFILNRLQAMLLSEAFRLVGEGYCTAEDLDKTVRDGLGLRWSFMGPFETIELNAPGGIPDYCKRYADSLFNLSKHPITPGVWGSENTTRVAANWGKSLTPAQVQEKSRWRDDRLAALRAHKREQRPFKA
jgi:3-hydroxyacyl-CoA dehydrogenase